MIRSLQALLIFAAVAVPAAAVAGEADTGEAEQRLRETITALSTHGSRMAGYPGDRFAADLIERELTATGVTAVRREPYDVVVPIDHGASLQVLGGYLQPAGVTADICNLRTCRLTGGWLWELSLDVQTSRRLDV